MQYLVDTGVWLRLFDRTDAEHANIREALRRLRASGHLLTICPQNIAEFWNVSTRATTARGGYGKSVATTERRAQFIERFGFVLEESPDAYAKWRALLVRYQIQGLAVHDARLVGMMLSAGITHILTLNVGDFARYQDQEIVAVTPVRVVIAGNS
jgi:predicted nucleic acid-binding protein